MPDIMFLACAGLFYRPQTLTPIPRVLISPVLAVGACEC